MFSEDERRRPFPEQCASEAVRTTRSMDLLRCCPHSPSVIMIRSESTPNVDSVNSNDESTAGVVVYLFVQVPQQNVMPNHLRGQPSLNF